MRFGQMVKELRLAQKKTLRQFCHEHGLDPSNWSKVERGVNPPPRDRGTLEGWAEALGLEAESGPSGEFMDLADIARGEIPREILSDEKLLAKLPVFFRFVRGAEPTESQLDGFIENLRKAYSPDPEES